MPQSLVPASPDEPTGSCHEGCYGWKLSIAARVYQSSTRRYRYLPSDMNAISRALCTQVLRYMILELIVLTTRH